MRKHFVFLLVTLALVSAIGFGRRSSTNVQKGDVELSIQRRKCNSLRLLVRAGVWCGSLDAKRVGEEATDLPGQRLYQPLLVPQRQQELVHIAGRLYHGLLHPRSPEAKHVRPVQPNALSP